MAVLNSARVFGAKEPKRSEQLAREPSSMQLRYLQTLTEIAGEKSSTIVFPIPMNLMEAVSRLVVDSVDNAGSGDDPAPSAPPPPVAPKGLA